MGGPRTYSEFEIEERLRGFARLITKDFSLKVVFEGESAYLSPEKMQIPPVENTPQAFSRAKFYVSHECGHALHSDFSVMKKAGKEDRRLPNILNSLEDARVEKKMLNEFPGLKKDMDKNIREIILGWEVEDMPLTAQLIYGMYLTGRDYDVTLFNKDAQNLLLKISPEINRANEAEDCNEVLAQAKKILEKIDQIVEEPPKIASSGMSGEEEGKSAESGDEHIETDSETQLEFSDQDKEKLEDKNRDERGVSELSEEAKEELKEADFADASISELIKDHFDQVRKDEDFDGMRAYEEYKDENNPEDETVVYPPQGSLSEYLRVFNPLRGEYNFLRQELKKIVAQRRVKKRRSSYVRRQKQGTVDTKRLWKIATGEDKIFKKRGEADTKEVDPDNLTVYLLLDESLSMREFNRYIAAKKAVIVLGETLNSLSIPFALTGYSTESKGLKRQCYVEFSDEFRIKRTRLNSIAYRHGTFTAEHLPFAQRRLEKRTERKKLLIVITDATDIESEYRLKRALDSLKNAGIEVIGIGVHTSFIAEYYDKFIEIKDLKGFGGKLLRLLRKILTTRR